MSKKIDKIIEKYLPKKATLKWLEAVFGKPGYSFHRKAAHQALIRPVWDFLERGGKRWRPLLFSLIVEAVGGNAEKLKDFFIIPELVHNGTLIIDDIEDDSLMRRGKPCLHKIFGTDIAVNAGNFLYFLPLLALVKNRNKFKKETLLKAYENYSQEMLNLHLGQAMDIYWHKGGSQKITEKQYLQMCAFKTGCLPRLTAKLAILLALGDEKLAEKMGKVAEAVGIAFQIKDDILNLAGGEFAKGKGGLGEDITEGKRSLIVIHALRKANERDRERLVQILGLHTLDRMLKNEALAIIKKYDSIDYARGKAEKLVRDAWRKIDRLLADSSAKNQLREFINYLAEGRKI